MVLLRTFSVVVAVLIVPRLANALPFTPDEIEITVLDLRFVESGTSSICLLCTDANPSNDFSAALAFPDQGFTSHSSGLVIWSGLIDFTGTTSTDFSNVDLQIEIDVRVRMRETMDPDAIALYPFPSVGFGTLTGFLMGPSCCFAGEPLNVLLENCCDGSNGNGVAFQDAAFPPIPFEIPEGNIHGLNLEVHVAEEAEYTPAPEPATLLLLGGGLAAALTRKSQGARARRLPRRQHGREHRDSRC